MMPKGSRNSSSMYAPVDELSASERSYRELRRMIVTGELEPGDVLSEHELAEQLNEGRTPVREAIQRLAWQHALVIFPRRGVAVANLGLQEVQGVFEAREAVEGKLAELAARRRTDAEAAELVALSDAVSQAASEDDLYTFLEKDQRLHYAIAACAKNAQLYHAVDQLLMFAEWSWRQIYHLHGPDSNRYFRHDEIVKAILNRDSPAARKAMEFHIASSRKSTVQSL